MKKLIFIIILVTVVVSSLAYVFLFTPSVPVFHEPIRAQINIANIWVNGSTLNLQISEQPENNVKDSFAPQQQQKQVIDYITGDSTGGYAIHYSVGVTVNSLIAPDFRNWVATYYTLTPITATNYTEGKQIGVNRFSSSGLQETSLITLSPSMLKDINGTACWVLTEKDLQQAYTTRVLPTYGLIPSMSVQINNDVIP